MRRRFFQNKVRNRNAVVTSELNPALQNILYSNGLAKNKDYTTKDELATINDEQFKNAFQGNTTLADLQALQYFTGITTIPENCFKSNTALCYVRLPKNITSIGKNAFINCSGLKKVLNFSNLNITANSTEFGYIGKYVEVLLNNPIVEDDYIFIFENNTYVLYDYLGNQCDLELSKTYKGNPYIIGKRAFYSNLNITSIIIPEGVTSIKNRAFSVCSNLINIQIPESVNDIDQGCFYGCSKLTSIIIPNNVTNIKESTFYNCSGLISIKISSNVTSIGDSAFYGCSKLTSIDIPNSVISIEPSAFRNCTNLISMKIGNSVTSIGNYVFSGCGLTSIELPNSVTNIGSSAFYGCNRLTSVVIPNSVTNIKASTFRSCSSLTSIVVEANNSVYDSREECNAIINSSTNTLICGCKNTIIPNSVTSIGDSAFYGCSGITSIEIPNSVTSIGYQAFYDCKSLTSVTIPNGVTSIGYSAFYGCSGLTSAVIPNSVTSIGERVFQKCSGLTSIEIPNSVISIGSYTFYNCSGLTSIIIPDSIIKIGEYAFFNCSGLTSITCKAINPPNIYNLTFNGINKSIPFYVPVESVETYKSAKYWNALTNIQAINN